MKVKRNRLMRAYRKNPDVFREIIETAKHTDTSRREAMLYLDSQINSFEFGPGYYLGAGLSGLNFVGIATLSETDIFIPSIIILSTFVSAFFG